MGKAHAAAHAGMFGGREPGVAQAIGCGGVAHLPGRIRPIKLADRELRGCSSPAYRHVTRDGAVSEDDARSSCELAGLALHMLLAATGQPPVRSSGLAPRPSPTRLTMTSPKIGMTVKDIHNVYCMDVAAPPRATSAKPAASAAKKPAKPTKAAAGKPAGQSGSTRK